MPFFLIALFFFLPILFSHLLVLVWVDMEIVHAFFSQNTFLSGIIGFEKIKSLFFIFVIFLLFWASFFFPVNKKISKNTLFFLTGLIGIFFLSSVLSEFRTEAFFWFGKKFHGFFVYTGCIILYFLLKKFFTPKVQKNILYAIFASFLVVSIYALFQKIGIDPIISSSRISADRVSGMLGNPNYLAGWGLMLLPLIFRIQAEKKVHYFLFFFVAFIIFLTKSWLAIVGVFLYILFLGWKKFPKTVGIISGIFFFAVCLYFFSDIKNIFSHLYAGEYDFVPEKIKGFLARPLLWISVLGGIFSDIKIFFFGSGFETLIFSFEEIRHPLLKFFEDPNYVADRAHNFFIDMWYFTGIFWFLCVGWIFFRGFRNLPVPEKTSLILFSLYFSFNIPVLVHFILLVFIFSREEY